MGELIRDSKEKYKRGNKEYEPYAGSVCTKFRQTVERAVEEVLLRDIVGRYRRNIYPTNIKELNVLKKEDWETLERLYDKYSKYEHDQTVESKVPMPTPTVIEADVNHLNEWIGKFNNRVDSFHKGLL